jgi:hypothetical protein
MPSGIYVRKPSKARDEAVARNFAKGRTPEAAEKRRKTLLAHQQEFSNEPVKRGGIKPGKFARDMGAATRDRLAAGEIIPPSKNSQSGLVWLSPEWRQWISERTKRVMHHPQTRKKHLAALAKVDFSWTEEKRKNWLESINESILSGRYTPQNNSRTTKFKVETFKGGTIFCQSSWEKIYAEWLDKNPKVGSFMKDKIRIPYVYQGKKRVYIVDFLVDFLDGRAHLVEIKPQALRNVKENPAKFAAARNWCKFQSHKTIFKVFTEKQLANIKKELVEFALDGIPVPGSEHYWEND